MNKFSIEKNSGDTGESFASCSVCGKRIPDIKTFTKCQQCMRDYINNRAKLKGTVDVKNMSEEELKKMLDDIEKNISE